MAKFTLDGIVLSKTDYSETSIILKVLTKEEGVKSFIFQGAKRKNKKGNLIQPLNQLSIEFYQRNDSELAKVSGIEAAIIYKSIPFDPFKSSIVFFINEILLNTLKSHDKNEELYDFISQILQVLDLTETYANLPIKFLFHYTKLIGFFPNMVENPRYFDMKNCSFTSTQPQHPNYLSAPLTSTLLSIVNADFDGKNDPAINREIRKSILLALVNYLHIVLDDFKALKSLPVLETLMED
ncbi:DNA repair protein RecO [Crocinitomix catalasitica]|uniref:DNA repair protein RecO n=1 Tax=Crocinitomix catalasitica TaxID=184607 RepID=UPI000481B0F1|nr:DNA repair protein RecO [Crocinitomix catalasitica]